MPVNSPPVVVDATSLTPSRFGLLTAATVEPVDGPRAWSNVLHRVNPFGPAHTSPNECLNAAAEPRDVPDGIPYEESQPVILFGGFKCRSVDLDEAEMTSLATAALVNGESPGLEVAAWPYLLGETDVFDTDNPVDQAVQLPDAPDLVAAVGALERWAYENYGGTPVIHAPRELAATAAQQRQVSREGAYLETILGTRWSFGNYPATGPLTDPEDPESGEPGTWLVITGQINIRRGPIRVRPGTFAASLDRTTNEVWALAERPFSVQIDGARAAIQIASGV